MIAMYELLLYLGGGSEKDIADLVACNKFDPEVHLRLTKRYTRMMFEVCDKLCEDGITVNGEYVVPNAADGVRKFLYPK